MVSERVSLPVSQSASHPAIQSASQQTSRPGWWQERAWVPFLKVTVTLVLGGSETGVRFLS